MGEKIKIVPLLDPLQDTLILEKVFSNLSLDDLKSCRQVCRLWSEEGAKNFRRRSIHVHITPIKVGQGTDEAPLKQHIKSCNLTRDKDRMHLVGFLNHFRIPHKLHISLLDFYSWKGFAYNILIFGRTKPAFVKEHLSYSTQRNNFIFAENLAENLLPQISGLATELWLEMSLRMEKDLDALEKILGVLEQNLERVFFNFVIFNEKGLEPGKKSHQQSSVKSFSVRLPKVPFTAKVVYNDPSGDYPPLSPPGASILLSLFPNVTFIDTIGFRPLHQMREVENKVKSFLFASWIRSMTLSGVRVRINSYSDVNALLVHCRNQALESIFMDICYKIEIPKLQELLDTSIKALDIIWRARGGSEVLNLKLPANLKILSLTSSAKIECCRDYNPWWEERATTLDDLFGLSKNFPQKLESLSLIYLGDEGIWDRIFPPPVQIISSNLKTLSITLVGECESEEIQKFPHFLFPNLQVFRHGRTADNGLLLFVCQHKYDPQTRKLGGKWEWLGGVKDYLFDHDVSSNSEFDHVVRHRFRVGLDFEGRYFTDTAWFLECEDHRRPLA